MSATFKIAIFVTLALAPIRALAQEINTGYMRYVEAQSVTSAVNAMDAQPVATPPVVESQPMPIDDDDNLDPNDCSRGIDEANQSSCDP